MTKARVSVIVPVYNVERYIEKCLVSLLNQTYNHIEIIVVDDGSTDKSREVIEHLSMKDQRIHYFFKKNGGLSSARNTGINHATGKYLSFVDSDDLVKPTFIEELVFEAEANNAEIAICNMTYVFDDGSERPRTPKIQNFSIRSGKEAFHDMLVGKSFLFHAVNKLYRTDLWENIRFPEGKIYEDVYTTYKVVFMAKRVVYINKDLYYYLQNRTGSILNSQFNDNRFDIFNAMQEIAEFCKKKSAYEDEAFQKFAISNVISMVNYLYPEESRLTREEFRRIQNAFFEHLEQFNFNNYWENSFISTVGKIRFTLIRTDLHLYCKIMRFIKRQN